MNGKFLEVNDYCLIKTKSDIRKLLLGEIVYVEQLGRKIVFHTLNAEELSMYEKIDYVMPYINNGFIITNRAVFNACYIKVITAGGLIRFFNGEDYQLSPKKTAEFRRSYARLLEKK